MAGWDVSRGPGRERAQDRRGRGSTGVGSGASTGDGGEMVRGSRTSAYLTMFAGVVGWEGWRLIPTAPAYIIR